MKRKFEDILSSLKESIADYKYYVNFDKIKRNVDKLKVELHILNSLIGSDDIEKKFEDIVSKYPNALKAIPILLAVRGTRLKIVEDEFLEFNFSKPSYSIDKYIKLMRESGLFDIMENNHVKDLVDYVTGVEVGLDSNARKNRTGTAMENIVESHFKKTSIQYHTQLNKVKIKEIFNVDLDALPVEEKGKRHADKAFDFVFESKGIVYLVETNFYGGGGSKLNETARSYKELAYQVKKFPNVKFVWITDGVGWRTVKRGLKETYDELEHFYTLADLENGFFFTSINEGVNND